MAVMERTSDRPAAHHLGHVTVATTSLRTVLRKKEEGAPANTHTSTRHPDSIMGLLVPRSPHRRNGSSCALLLADLHPRFHDRQQEGGTPLSCGGKERDVE